MKQRHRKKFKSDQAMGVVYSGWGIKVQIFLDCMKSNKNSNVLLTTGSVISEKWMIYMYMYVLFKESL